MMMKKKQYYDRDEHLLIAPDKDKEIRPVVLSMKPTRQTKNVIN